MVRSVHKASSLVDWDMSSDRNEGGQDDDGQGSLVDWDMSSDRNGERRYRASTLSLVDWDMSSDRNYRAGDYV